MTSREHFFCPTYFGPATYHGTRWPCPDRPCRGHRATRAVYAAADAIAEEDGYDGLAGVPTEWRQAYLNWAGVFTWDTPS